MSNIPVNSLTSKKDRNVFTWQPLGHWKFILIWNVNTKSIFLVECFPHFHFLIKSNYNIKSRVERERRATTCLHFTSCNIIFSMSTVHWDSKNTCIGVKKQILDELYSVPSPYWYSPLGLSPWTWGQCFVYHHTGQLSDCHAWTLIMGLRQSKNLWTFSFLCPSSFSRFSILCWLFCFTSPMSFQSS